MQRLILCLTFILILSALAANPNYYPLTVTGELFEQTGIEACADAEAGFAVLQNTFHPGEFIGLRFYENSGDLTNPAAVERFNYYDISPVPAAIFKGITSVEGGGIDIADGNTYLAALQSYLFAPSPLRMSVPNFNPVTGAVQVTIALADSFYTLNNQTLRIFLLENNVSSAATEVTRDEYSEAISLSGYGDSQTVNHTFTVLPSYQTGNLWIAALVQNDNHTILQAASSLPQPQYQIRAAFPFSAAIIDSAGINYNSAPLWLFNTGATETFTIQLLQDDGPAGWYFNYCSEDGLCYPGTIPHPFTLQAGEAAGFHLNLSVGSSGTAHFHFLIDSEHIEPYIIPFSYQTSDTPVQEQVLPVPELTLTQNYPNPFTAETTFTINAKHDGNPVSVVIYNCKGQAICSISSGKIHSGKNQISWNGTAENGQRPPAGIYFYRLQNAADTSVRKLLLLPN
ncbi:MAG: T9SS type A sorting domain-containing protein [Candidatus Cloacimonadaceae bacterium]